MNMPAECDMKTKITFSRTHTGVSRFVPDRHPKVRLCCWLSACLLLCVTLFCIACCSNKPVNKSVQVTRDATLMREQFATTRIVVTAPNGHRIVVVHDGRRAEEIALNRSSSGGGLDKAEIFLVAALTPLPAEKETLLHWTAYIRSGGAESGGPTEAPRRVGTQNLGDIFKVTVIEGAHEMEETIVSVAVCGEKYDFVIK